MTGKETTDIVIADLDGVLAHPWSEGDYTFKPKMRIPAQVILTNQGGVPLRWCKLPGSSKYPKLGQVIARVRAGMRYSGARWAIVACYHPRQESVLLGRILARVGGRVLPIVPVIVREGAILLSFSPRARKPSPWGINLARWLMGRRRKNITFYGDEESDEETARNAGVSFVLVPSERSNKRR
jgi:hypothetical protein